MSNKLGIALGVIAGTTVVAGGIALSIPKIRDSVLNIGSKDIVEETNSELKSDYEIQIENLTSQLNSKNEKILEYENLISQKSARIEELNEIEASLRSEIELYKELVGSDANYLEIINGLQSDLTSTINERDLLLVQVEQLTLNHSVLEQNVIELETELNEVKDLLNKFIDTENLDKLQVSSYNGTWYLNGTYEEYFDILDGQVSYGKDNVKGIIQVQSNEMKMWLNNGLFKSIELTDNGTAVLVDGVKFTKYIINTEYPVEPNFSSFSGEFLNGTNSITLNNDNTIFINKDGIFSSGTYIVKSSEKNVAGNKTINNLITATIYNSDGSTSIIEFNNISYSGVLSDIDGVVYNQVLQNYGFEFRSPDNLDGKNASYFSDCYKVTFKLSKPLNFIKNTKSYFRVVLNSEGRSVGYVNGSNYSSNGTFSTSYDIGTFVSDTDNVIDYLTLYIKASSTEVSYFNNSDNKFLISTKSQRPDLHNNYTVEMIPICYEKLGNVTSDLVMKDFFYKQDSFIKNCSPIKSILQGEYLSDNISFSLNSDDTTSLDYKTNYGASFKNCVFEEVDEQPTADNTYSVVSKQFGLDNGSDYVVNAYFKLPDNLEEGVEYNFSPYAELFGGNINSRGYTVTLDDLNGAKYICLPIVSSDNIKLSNYRFTKISCKLFVNNVYSTDFIACGGLITCFNGLVEEPVISNVLVSAETNGVDIFHNVNLTISTKTISDDGIENYVEDILIFELKNHSEILSATLNGSSITLIKG